MINKIKTQSGILHSLLKKKTISFTPGVNVVWGRNGVGKSLLLRTMANYCFVEQTGGGGWSQGRGIFGFHFSDYEYEYKMKDKNLSNVYEFDKHSKINIDWSGDAAFYMHHDNMIDWTHTMGYEMGGSEWITGLGKIMKVYKNHGHHPSTGQLIKGIVELLLTVDAPDLSKKEDSYRNDFSTYINKRKKLFKGEFKPTLLLDEVDSQLDLFNQMWFHKEIVPQLAEKFQIIMVSHSIFAATYYPTIIELDDSLQMVKKELNIK